MNKKLSVALAVLYLLLVMLSIPAFAEDASVAKSASPDFKQFFWGDSMEKVLQVEGEPLFTEEENGRDVTYIAYKTTAVGLDVLLAYYFCNDGLYQATYLLDEEHSNESMYIDDYETFRDALTKKYGEPAIDTEIWENDSKKKYYADKKGDALCYGYLKYVTYYETDTSDIAMLMSADNYDITMGVTYYSNAISHGEVDYSDEI